jgi:release factor glutamine methyltransferase
MAGRSAGAITPRSYHPLAMPTAGELIDDAERALKDCDAIEHPHAGKERYDAEAMLAFVLGSEPDGDDDVSASVARRFHALLARRLAGEPVAYVTGRAQFKGMSLRVGPGAFIPRESSEFMAEQAIRRLLGRRAPVHVDLATGVGPVALAVARAVPEARVIGVDLYPEPVAMARRNAAALGLANATFRRGDLFGAVPSSVRGSADVITIHPPYVGTRELHDLPREIVGFEPRGSLTDSSPTGMGLVQRTVDEAPTWLRSGGWLLMEVAPDRARDVATVFRRGGLRDVRSTKDHFAVTRVVVGRA